MELIDLTREWGDLVRTSHGTIEFKAAFWAWLDRQRREGPLAPLLEDMERHWSSVGNGYSLSEARDLMRRLEPAKLEERVRQIGDRFREVTGELPAVPLILLAGLGRPEGYSRFDRGRNTIFLGLDHPTALAHFDHLEVILSHELCHAVRDPDPAVLKDYGGAASMSHDDFVARHPFREHLVSEALATAVSEKAFPGRPERRYVYFDAEAVAWCRAHRREIADRMVLALEREEPYRTFYSEGSVMPGSPDCCDYWFGLHLARFALGEAGAGELLRLPSTRFLERFLSRFVDEFAGPKKLVAVPGQPAAPGADDASLAAASLPASVREVYADYEALLAHKPALARRLDDRFQRELQRTGLEYAGEAWDVHAFPLLLSVEEERNLRWATDGLLRLIDQVVESYRSDPEVRAFFGLPRHVEELCMLDPGYRPHVMLGRFDSFWSGRRTHFLELNANGAAMWCLAEFLGEGVMDLPELGPLLDSHGCSGWPLSSRMLDGLLSAWRQARGDSGRPRNIAIVDWSDVSTRSEQTRLAQAFTSMGSPTSRVAPSELRFDGRELTGPCGPIDLIYRRLTVGDVIDRPDELRPMLDAARANAVVTVSSYSSDVAHSKRLFAFLTHERWQRRLSPAQRALVNGCVPWTRMFVPGRTQYEGRRHDLKALALSARERFVIKPAEGYEGRGVLLGAETPPELWEAEVERRFGGAHVIQERVRAPLRRLLVPNGDAGVAEVDRWLHLGEFVIGGQTAGYLARTSEELVLSADSKERTLPCLVVAEDDADHDRELGPSTP